LNLLEASQRLSQFAAELRPAVDRTIHDKGREAWREAIRRSSGTFTQKQFNTPVSRGGLGAPYGHGDEGWLGPRGPVPYGDLGMINAQQGAFRSEWQLEAGKGFAMVVNHSQIAQFLVHGTRLRKARPIDKRTMQMVLPTVRPALLAAIKDIRP
jgi:alkylation response protein AidB-like acyl-CoA dehydrogenase